MRLEFLSVTNDERTPFADNEPAECLLSATGEQALKMPIPFTTDGTHNTIVYPNGKGHLHFEYGQRFRLSCTTAKFEAADLQEAGDAQVTCEGDDRLGYKGRTYRYAATLSFS